MKGAAAAWRLPQQAPLLLKSINDDPQWLGQPSIYQLII
jgi:hypothetical protein